MNNFFYKHPSRPVFYIGSDTFVGQCKRQPATVDVSNMIQYFTKEYRDRKMIEMIAGCNEIKLRLEIKNFPSCIIKVSQLFSSTGYARMSRNIIQKLLEKDINLQCFSNVSTVDYPIKEVLKMCREVHYDGDVSGPMIYVSSFARESKRHSCFFTMSEYDDTPNDHHVKALNVCNEIWVPSEWNKEIFSRRVKKDIFTINLGVDSDFFSKRHDGEVVFSSGTNSFIFLCLGTFIWRKGFDCLIKAYNKAFTSKDDVTLLFLSKNAFSNQDKMTSMFIDEMKKSCAGKSAHISICFSDIAEEAMPYIYSRANAYAMLSRGEGWGLPYIEAASCGLPIIGSYHGGQSAFLSPEDSFLVVPDTFSYAPQYYVDIVDMYQGVKFADFSDRVIDEVAQKMRYVYDNYSVALEKANSARKRITRYFTWDRTADLVYNRILNLQK